MKTRDRLLRALELYQPNQEIIETRKNRQAAYWKGERNDSPLLMLNYDLTSEQEALMPVYDKEQEYHDPYAMLSNQLRGSFSKINGSNDAVPSVRVNMGTGITLSCLGLNQTIYKDKMPWLHEHLTKEQISALTPDDIRIRDDFEKALEYTRIFKELLGDRLPIFCLDTQGPFDLAHLMMGDELLYVLYDDPKFVHHLLNLCTELNIRCHKWVKELSGEPLTSHYHGNHLYMENAGVRICEDTTVMISPEMMEEFTMPYRQRVAEEFGGAWVHYCGRNAALTENICRTTGIKGLNFGLIPGKEFDHDFEADFALCRKHSITYNGSIPILPKESGKEFLRRIYSYGKAGNVILSAQPALKSDDFSCAEKVAEFWQTL